MRHAPVLPFPASAALTARTRFARTLAQATAWADFARARTTQLPAALLRKAFDAARFTTHERARNFAVPSKLAGTRAHAANVEALARTEPPRFLPLAITEHAGQLLVSFEDDRGALRPLGFVQPKHAGWVAPLLAHGVRLYLLAVTGQEREGATLGVNVAFGHVGPAVTAALAASPTPPYGSGPSGDGATHAVAEPVAPYHAGLAGAVRLHRDARGEPHATFTPPGTTYTSRDGIEWAYGGWGPLAFARLVLAYFEGETAADAFAGAFKREVVAILPREGGLSLTAADVRRWLDATTSADA